MKRHKISVVLVLSVTSVCQAVQAVPLFNVDDTWGREKIRLAATSKPVGEMLALFSQEAHANVFSDVTEANLASLVSPVVNPKNEVNGVVIQSRSDSLQYISFEGHMWFDRNDSNTYVLWPQPDLVSLSRLIVAEQQQFDARIPPADRAATLNALKTFYAQEKGWNPNPKTPEEKAASALGVSGDLPLTDFPKPLQDALRSELVFRLRVLESSYEPAAWTADYWKNARVRLHMTQRTRTGQLRPSPYDGLPTVDVQFPPDRERDIRGFAVGQAQQIKVSWHSPSRPHLNHSVVCAPDAVGTANVAPQVTTTPVATIRTSSFEFDPQKEEALQKPVKLAHQSSDLTEIVTDLSRQTGATLEIAPNVAPHAKTMALSEGMTLAGAMSALARLYCARWQKVGPGYSLRSEYLDELHTLMVQMGECAFYRVVAREPKEMAETGNDLAGQIVDSCDLTKLKSEEGVVFSSLPTDLQQSVRDLMSEENVGELIVAQQRVDDALSSGVRIRFAPRTADVPQLFGAFYTGGAQLGSTGDASILAAYTADGRYITRLFPEFMAAKMSRSEAITAYINQQQREREAKMNQPPPNGAAPQ